MFCPSCGAQIPDVSVFCPACGARVGANAAPAAQNTDVYRQTAPQVQSDRYGGMPMKWHKFLVYFALWFAALANVGNGIRVMTGEHYDGKAEVVYGIFEKMKTFDLVYGIASIGVGLLLFVAAFRLLKLKQGAPALLLTCMVIAAVISVLYAVGAITEIHSVVPDYSTSEITSSAIGTGVGSAVSFILHQIYYKKRKHLFVN